uniref:hypothetical protein n=1 Tax=Streptomyces alboverticillatus TaxID=173770 RepID=UPI00117F3ED2
MTSPEHPLLTAVRNGDTKAVAALLQEEYGTTHARGPHVAAALRLAADALDHRVLDALLKLADLDAMDLDGAQQGRAAVGVDAVQVHRVEIGQLQQGIEDPMVE